MRVTPLDIIQKEFSSVRRGFSQDEVRVFLDEVRESLESALKENHRLKDMLATKDQEIAALREGEMSIKDTLVLARQLATDVRRGAHREADVIIGEARIEAERILAAAHDEHANLLEQLTRLGAARVDAIARLRAVLGPLNNFLHEMESAPVARQQVKQPALDRTTH